MIRSLCSPGRSVIVDFFDANGARVHPSEKDLTATIALLSLTREFVQADTAKDPPVALIAATKEGR